MKFRKTTLVLVTLLFLGLFSFASFVPSTVSASPHQLDVMFAFDLSGSMADDIAAAKKMASDIMVCLNKETWLDVRFGLITYVDYPYYYNYCGYAAQYGVAPDYPYALNVSLTKDKTLVNDTIQALGLFNGADAPQDYTRIMHEGWNDSNIGWRAECTVKIMVNFGDNVPHDHNLNELVAPGVWNTGVDPGRDAIAGTADDLDLQTEILNLLINDIEWFEIHGTGIGLFPHWGYWAGCTNGRAYDLHTTTVAQVNFDIVNKVIEHEKEIPPSDVELYPQRVEDLGDPRNTTWHELHPVKSRYYKLTSWEPGRVLSSCDQIDMTNITGGVEWFEVDEVTVDIVVNETKTGTLRWLEYKCGYWIFKKEVETNPISSKWNELKPLEPYPERCWHLTSWEDNGDGKLSPCDTIDMTPMHPWPGPTTWFHVESVTVTLKLTKKPLTPYWLEFMGTLDEFQRKDYIHNPLGTFWHEILPIQGRIWNLTSWVDTLVLSPSDQIDLTDEYGITRWYHVDKLTVAMNMTNIYRPEQWRIVKFEGSLKQFKKYHWTNPVSTQWHEVNPVYSRQWHLTYWKDTGEPFGKLSHCDEIYMMDKETGLEEIFHVETLSTDMWLTVKIPPPPPPPPLPPMFWKANFTDYAPSGMPDFDQKQDLWKDAWGEWTWCAPVAVANSLWWMDSRYETSTTPPPTINDTFPLVTNYTPGIDDHDPANAPLFIKHLAYLMDTNGIRTGIVHSGTTVNDTQAGIAHYLSWTGLNPKGDVNGDGVTNQTDWNIVNASLGSSVVGGVPVPGPNGEPWNMAADIWPVTLGWPTPGVADNVVNASDLALVTANNGSVGMFYEQTVPAPDFYFIEEEVEKSEDVILFLGFYNWTGTMWYRKDVPYSPGSGHAVTVAGVNSTMLQNCTRIAISDPIQDNAEAGGPGRVLPPPPHGHPAAPPDTIHNNATYVSQDIYNVTWISPPLPPPPPPNPPANWTLVGYTSPQYPPIPFQFIALIEYAITISPLPVHDVAIINVTPAKTVVGQGYKCKINVTVENQGGFQESFNVTVYYQNTTGDYLIGTQTGITLAAGASINLTFTWDTKLGVKRNYTLGYTIFANATVVSGETETGDNTYTDGTVKVVIPGNFNADNQANVLDLGKLGVHWGPAGNPYNANVDIDCNGEINVIELGTLGVWWQDYE